jgi:uncharacterized protein
LMRCRLLALLAIMLGASLGAGGCASQPLRFYVLSALPGAVSVTPAMAAGEGPAVGVGPVTLPRYLDRPHIVTSISPHELRVAEFDRWAESLDANFARVLAENLSWRVPTSRVSVFPWPLATAIDYQVVVEVTQFLSRNGGESVLIANWNLLRGERPQALATGTSRLSATAVGEDYAAIAAAMSQTVAEFSRDIAMAIRGLEARGSIRETGSRAAAPLQSIPPQHTPSRPRR